MMSSEQITIEIVHNQGREFACIFAPRRGQRECACGFEIDRRIRKHPLHGLEITDRFSKRFAFTSVREHFVLAARADLQRDRAM